MLCQLPPICLLFFTQAVSASRCALTACMSLRRLCHCAIRCRASCLHAIAQAVSAHVPLQLVCHCAICCRAICLHAIVQAVPLCYLLPCHSLSCHLLACHCAGCVSSRAVTACLPLCHLLARHYAICCLAICCRAIAQAVSAHVPLELLVEQIESLQSITKLQQVFSRVSV